MQARNAILTQARVFASQGMEAVAGTSTWLSECRCLGCLLPVDIWIRPQKAAHRVLAADAEAEDELSESVEDDPVVVRARRVGRQQDDANQDDRLRQRDQAMSWRGVKNADLVDLEM